LSSISPAAQTFLEYLATLKTCAATRMMESPKKEKEKSRNLRALWKKTRAQKAEVEELEQELEGVQNKIKEKLDNKNNEIRNEGTTLERFRRKFQDDIKQIW